MKDINQDFQFEDVLRAQDPEVMYEGLWADGIPQHHLITLHQARVFIRDYFIPTLQAKTGMYWENATYFGILANAISNRIVSAEELDNSGLSENRPMRLYFNFKPSKTEEHNYNNLAPNSVLAADFIREWAASFDRARAQLQKIYGQ